MTIPPPTEKQAKILWASFTALAIGILITLTAMLMIGVGWIANALSSVLIPLAIAGIIAYILDPVVDWCHKKRRMKRHNAIILVFIIAILLVGGLLASIVPALVDEATKLKTEFPKKAKVFQQKVNSLVQTNTTNTSTNTPNNNFLLNLPKWAQSVGLTNEKAGEFGVVAVSNVSSWLLEQLKKITKN